MAETSKISWTDATFNPWMGCTKVSAACAHCYAERDFDHRYGKVKWGQNGTRVVTSEANWRKPYVWNRAATLNGEATGPNRIRVFCASLADIFEDWRGPMLNSKGLPLWKCHCGNWFGAARQGRPCPRCGDLRGSSLYMNDVRARLFALIDATLHLDWLLLTKRPQNIPDMWPDDRYRDNVWLGATAESQELADIRVPELLQSRHLSPVLFLSCEPLLGKIADHSNPCFPGDRSMARGWCFSEIDWLICGGESGPNARPSNVEWFRALRDQCDVSGVPFHFKQWGEFDQYGIRTGRAAAGNMLDGRLHLAFPKSGAST